MVATSANALRNRLKLRQLSLLVALDELGSLHKAAAKIGMTQPAATRLLHELEELLASPLFDRTSRGLIANAMGRLLIRHASGLIAGVDTLHQETKALMLGHVGNLKIGVSTGVRPDLVPLAIMQLKQDTEALEVQIQEGTQEDLLTALRQQRVEIVIGRAPAMDATGGLSFEALYDEQFSIACKAANRNLKPPRKSPLVYLVDQPWILPPGSTALRKTLENQFVAQCGRLPSNIIDSAAVVFNLALVNSSDYVVLMPKLIADYYAKRSQLRVLVPAVPLLAGTVGMIFSNAGERSPHVVRLANALRMTIQRATP